LRPEIFWNPRSLVVVEVNVLSSDRTVWFDCLHRFIKAGAKYDAVNRGSRLERRDAISVRETDPPSPAVPPAPSLAGSPRFGPNMAVLRRRSRKRSSPSRKNAPARPPTTPPTMRLVVTLSKPPPEDEDVVAEGAWPVAVAPESPPPKYVPVLYRSAVVVASGTDVVE
jgi:hypothetical protein